MGCSLHSLSPAPCIFSYDILIIAVDRLLGAIINGKSSLAAARKSLGAGGGAGAGAAAEAGAAKTKGKSQIDTRDQSTSVNKG